MNASDDSLYSLGFIHDSGLNNILAKSKLLRRLLRFGIHHVVPVGDTIVVFANRKIFTYNREGKRWEYSATCYKNNRPLSVCKTPNNDIYYGEYWSNPVREPVKIVASFDHGKSWESIFEIENIRHVHGTFYDEYEDAIWVSTGDEDHESKILKTLDRFESIQTVLEGAQQVRAIQLLFTKEYVYFGSDSPSAINKIYRYERSNGKLEELQIVGGSVFWGCSASDWLLFSTAVEPSRVNKQRYAELWGASNGTDWKLLAKFKKDSLPLKYFQYGQLFLPNGKNESGTVWLTPFSTKNSQRLISLDLNSIALK